MIYLEDVKIQQDFYQSQNKVSFIDFQILDNIQLRQIQEVQSNHPYFDSFNHLIAQPSIIDQGNKDQIKKITIKPSHPNGKDETCEDNPKEPPKPSKWKNQTKNISKNFGKGIISYILHKTRKMRPIVQSHNINFISFLDYIKKQRRCINTIAELRQLWTHSQFGSCFRSISNHFFRKHALYYIFNSRISSYACHIKYRQTLWQALRTPHDFNRIKQF